MSGTVINDSILKIDTINQLRNSGLPLLKAIQTGGLQHVKAIINNKYNYNSCTFTATVI